MKWARFKKASPMLVRRAQKLFKGTELVLLGTIRKDGSPRISPVEPTFCDGELYLGMMWRSLKALDLLRDPRCTVHSAVRDRMGSEGEFKLHGRARNIRDRKRRQRYCQALYKRIGWAPKEPHGHLFAIDVRSAGLFITKGNQRIVKRWRRGGRIEQFRQNP